MTERTLEADYVIVGTGAVAMAFADTLLTDTEASIIIGSQAQAGRSLE